MRQSGRGIGRVRIDEAMQWARSKAFVQVSNKLVTTKAVMLEEEGMIEGARAGQGKHEAIGRGGTWEMTAELTDEQKKGYHPHSRFSGPGNRNHWSGWHRQNHHGEGGG